MRIEVTQEDIDLGEPCDPLLCPVALAIDRQLPGSDCEVEYCTIDLEPGMVFKTPQSVRNFIAAFDEEEPVAPFSFDLDIPQPTNG